MKLRDFTEILPFYSKFIRRSFTFKTAIMKISLTIMLMFCITKMYSQEPVVGKEIVFTPVNVIPMDKEEVLTNQTVVVKNGVITEMGDAATVKYNKKATVIDAKGKYLVPGLAEMHAHVPTNADEQSHKDIVKLFALHGITTIRGMLGHPSHITLREKLRTGEILGPILYTSGPAVSGGSVKSPEQAVALVKEEKKAGYDFLKILPGLTKENFAVVAKTAKEEGIRFAGHISFDVGVWNSINAEYQTIDHMDGFVEGLVPGVENMTEKETGFFGMNVARQADQSKIPVLMDELKKHNVWVVPTQALAERWISSERSAEALRAAPEMKYMDAKTLDAWVKTKSSMKENPSYDSAKITDYIALRRKLIFAINQSGVGLLLGCDAPQVFNVPGVATHHELKYLVDAGLTPYEALKTGTVNVARFYKKEGKAGVVRKGAASELILLNANPLEDISNSRKIEGVMLRDKWLSKSYIEQSLKQLEKTN